FEYEAKEAFRQVNMPLPPSGLATTPEEAEKITSELASPVVVKVQILAGGRGKAGGIKFANTASEAKSIAADLFQMTIHDHPVHRVLIEKQLDIQQEIYLGITIDRSRRRAVVICSAMGGVDIEQVAEEHPERISRLWVDPILGLRDFEARQVVKDAGFDGRLMLQIAGILLKLWQVFLQNDAELTEINPLIVTKDGDVLAADARLNVDDNALFRHKALAERVSAGISERTELEQRAQKLGMTYVELEGNIGIIGNGAGLVMATMDAVKYYGGAPANFLDVGGGATADRMHQALDIVLSHPDVEAVFINILGGITRCDEMARGIVEAQKSVPRKVPIVIRMIGTREKEGAEILEKATIPFLNSMDAAAKRVVTQAKKEG
ncbi:MAG: ADP-forming succinate--CoA ligase subunit beta, partial [Candidatus Hermodarchaeota archaeon]|nr:ADP-forming succinate--CoA ligase subunit beta [Candidatus Hermodarchaeota archaeon]